MAGMVIFGFGTRSVLAGKYLSNTSVHVKSCKLSLDWLSHVYLWFLIFVIWNPDVRAAVASKVLICLQFVKFRSYFLFILPAIIFSLLFCFFFSFYVPDPLFSSTYFQLAKFSAHRRGQKTYLQLVPWSSRRESSEILCGSRQRGAHNAGGATLCDWNLQFGILLG